MAKQSRDTNEPRFETIKSNRLAIEKGSLIAGNISFQIRNIATLLVSKDDSHDGAISLVSLIVGVAAGVLLWNVTSNMLGSVVGGLICAGGTYGILEKMFVKHELQLLTNAATSFRLFHRDEKFLLGIKSAIEEVMQHADNSIMYQVNIGEQKIDRIEANTTHVAHSPGAAVIGGSATNVTQSTNAIAQGLQDISALIELIDRSNNEYKDFYIYHLKTVQQYLAGTRSKDEAKASWAKFVEYVSLLAVGGNNIWGLVGRIANLLT